MSNLKLDGTATFAALQAIINRIDAGTNSSTLIIYGGSIPADPTVVITDQPVLVSFILPRPSFTIVQNPDGIATLKTVAPALAQHAGEATFFRIVNGDTSISNPVIIQGDVSDTSGDGDLTLSSTDIHTGVYVKPVSLIITMPSNQ